MRGACESRTAEQGTHPRRTRPQCPTAPKRMHGACATECAARAAKHCRQCSARAQCAAVGSHLQRCRQAACLRSPARDKLAKRQRFTANLQPGCRAQLQESRRVCPPWPRVSGRPPRRAVLACSTLSILGPTWAAAACRATQRAYRGPGTQQPPSRSRSVSYGVGRVKAAGRQKRSTPHLFASGLSLQHQDTRCHRLLQAV